MGLWNLGARLVLFSLALPIGACPIADALSDEPGDVQLAQAEGPEPRLEGDLKAQYLADRAAYERELKKERGSEGLAPVVRRLVLLPGRAGRDAILRLLARERDPAIHSLAVGLLARRTDGVSLRYVCGPQALGTVQAFPMGNWAVGQIEDAENPHLVPYLLEVADDRRSEPLVRGVATRVAAKLSPKDPRVLATALTLMKHNRREARYPTVEALGYIATPDAMEVVIAALEERESYVRGSAFTAVANARRYDLLPHLRELAAKEGNSGVRSEADTAIAELEKIEREETAKRSASAPDGE